MKIKDLFNNSDLVFSCEVFPPKPDSDVKIIHSTIERLSEIKPDYISVTYGAGGGTKDSTIEISSSIIKKFNMEALMHLTCIDASVDDMRKILHQLKDNTVENILALRGDLPVGKQKHEVLFDYKYASDLVKFIKQNGNFCIGVAGYPEVHHESHTMRKDIMYLKNKVENGADFINTQLFFKNDFFFNFIDNIRSAGINIPVSAGIMPIYKARMIKRIVELSHASIPSKLASLLDKYSHDDADMEKAGLEFASCQISGLLEQGVEGIHLYTMNNADIAFKIAKNLNLR
ncbi:methylenetetrahydrofolate reductase [NAD(P)H] [Elusimicrobiota bacterium]